MTLILHYINNKWIITLDVILQDIRRKKELDLSKLCVTFYDYSTHITTILRLNELDQNLQNEIIEQYYKDISIIGLSIHKTFYYSKIGYYVFSYSLQKN